MKSLTQGLLLAPFAVLTGCVYWPHHDLTAPTISGTVVRAGKPVVGEHVQLADVMTTSGDVSPSALTQETITDAQGHFSIGPIRRFAKTAPMPLFNVRNNVVPWGLRLSPDARTWQAGWLTDATLIGDVPDAPIIAACDLGAASKSSVITGDNAMVGNGPCNLSMASKKKK
ncbi:carboxypeptidase-like regulatory domain-containing protein [Rhodanobacter sp. L36]|uniref:carboxypeptidase-like regulatory domain-containing protein n=1 Tax=Rhodanobacter sp. L36 TaxID=1747221 RepID=UPI00131EC44A|nr:carboxypeptidase-like regulatory domain-containing protein [Rhodanobacter sp. L36]